MKRFLTVLFTTLVLTAALCVTASASTFDDVAEELAGIGMFRGTASGFELDRAPTRSEAAIMLVRLYGAEETAQAAYAAGEIEHPFTDVSEFAAPYVAWLYTNGITNGVSATEFGSSRPCTAQNYTVFLLRALGFQDGADFQYADAPAFAAGKGLLDLSSIMEGTFLRDDLAGMTYQALACDLKDGSTYLLDSLVKSGAIDAAAAKPIVDKIEAYRALANLVQENSLDVDFAMNMDMKVSMSGKVMGQDISENEEISAKVSGKIQMVLDGSDAQIGMQMSMDVPDMDLQEEAGMWLRDGWMYVDMDGMQYKQDLSGEMDEFLTLYQEIMDTLDPTASAAMMLPFIDSITTETSGQDTVYTLRLNSALSGLVGRIIDEAMKAIGEEGMSMEMNLGQMTYTYTVSGSGELKAVGAVLQLGMKMGMSEASDSVTIAVDVDVDMDMKVNATGKSVKVSYPSDLNSYPDIMSGMTYPEDSDAGVIGGADGPTSVFSVSVM